MTEQQMIRDYLPLIDQKLDMLIDSANRWIPVSEDLPLDGQMVIIIGYDPDIRTNDDYNFADVGFYEDKYIKVGGKKQHRKGFYVYRRGTSILDKACDEWITHWMPFPHFPGNEVEQ